MKYKFEFSLPVGATIKIAAFPYEYLGKGVFGGNTPPEDPVHMTSKQYDKAEKHVKKLKKKYPKLYSGG